MTERQPFAAESPAALKVCREVETLRQLLSGPRQTGRIALVPTMGNLHDGHLSLVREARRLADTVVVSLFVNPLQFAAGEDFESYPRTLESDAQALEKEGAQLLFAPTVEEMYPAGQSRTRIDVGDIGDMLCGAHRAGHFSGMATVVCMLFNQVRPHVAVFGEKDYQQLQVIRQMVLNLHIPVSVRGVPTVREADGLAMSSRNQYLTPKQRGVAPKLHECLVEAARRVRSGGENFVRIQSDMKTELKAAGFEPDYFELRAADLSRPHADTRQLVVLAAAHLGRARLIDNLQFDSKL